MAIEPESQEIKRPDPPGWDTAARGPFPFPSDEELQQLLAEGDRELRELHPYNGLTFHKKARRRIIIKQFSRVPETD